MDLPTLQRLLSVTKSKVWCAIVACRTAALGGHVETCDHCGVSAATFTIPAATFIDRFLLHVLPPGFKRIRHYGLLGTAAKAVKLAQARAALAVPAPDPVVVESVAALMRRIEHIGWARCPHCGQGDFVPTAAIPMPPRPALHARGPP